MDDEYLGIVKLFAGTFALKNFLFCDGSLLLVEGAYNALFSLIGFSFGGDGNTQFQLPDLRGIVPVGAGLSRSGTPYQLGKGSGMETTTLTTTQLPTHTHTATFTPTGGGGTPITASVTINAGTGGTVTNDPTNAYWGKSPSSGAAQSQDYTNQKNVQMASDAVQVVLSGGGGGITGGNVANAQTGLGLPFSNMPPYLPLNYIICVQGLYPSQS